MHNLDDARDQFITALMTNAPVDTRAPLPDFDTLYAINPDAINYIVDELQLLIADTVATIINAGSERDCVLENQSLTNAIRGEIADWIAGAQ